MLWNDLKVGTLVRINQNLIRVDLGDETSRTILLPKHSVLEFKGDALVHPDHTIYVEPSLKIPTEYDVLDEVLTTQLLVDHLIDNPLPSRIHQVCSSVSYADRIRLLKHFEVLV